jgi:hypothetical protein
VPDRQQWFLLTNDPPVKEVSCAILCCWWRFAVATMEIVGPARHSVVCSSSERNAASRAASGMAFVWLGAMVAWHH